METFNRLAGVQDTTEITNSPDKHRPHPIPIPPPKDHDTDAITSTPTTPTTANNPNSQRASRASLPLNRKPSHRSFRSVSRRTSIEVPPLPDDLPPTPQLPSHHIAHQQQLQSHQNPPPTSTTTNTALANRPLPPLNPDTASDAGTEFTWGPTHPCFPHPNPYVPRTSPLATSTRVIRVRRDYLLAGERYPAFANLYPEILEPLVSEAEFRKLITGVNELCRRAYEPGSWRAWGDAVVGALTGYVSEDLGLTGVRKGEKEVEGFVEGWNREMEGLGREVRVVELWRTGYMNLDLVVPDPGVDEVVEG